MSFTFLRTHAFPRPDHSCSSPSDYTHQVTKEGCVCVCVCVCVLDGDCVYMCVRVCGLSCVCVLLSAHLSIYVFKSNYLFHSSFIFHICVSVYLYYFVCLSSISICLSVYLPVSSLLLYMQMYLSTCVCVCVCVCVFAIHLFCPEGNYVYECI